jgi:hypothetical protein
MPPAKKVQRKLKYDVEKHLKGGKRRYVNRTAEGRIAQSEYLDADEVKKLGEPDSITVTITAP